MTATLHPGHDRSTLRFERRLNHGVERVWLAVTDPDELVQWFPSAVVYEPRVGASMRFDFGGKYGLDPLPGEVVEWDPPRVFAFAWGEDLLRFELSPTGDTGTLLVFTHSFSHEPGKPARDAAGWEACFEAFDALLDGRERPDGSERWAAHHDAYVKQFGELTLEADGVERHVRLRGPLVEADDRPAVLVTLGDVDGVLIVRDRDAAFQDGAAIEVREGTTDEPGALLAEGVLHDPLAAAVR